MPIFHILTAIQSDALVRNKYSIKTCIKFNMHRAWVNSTVWIRQEERRLAETSMQAAT